MDEPSRPGGFSERTAPLRSWEQPQAGFDDAELSDMANLTRDDTGVDGIIYISTAEGGHGPRVKWFPDRPQRGAPCLSVTIEDDPVARNLKLAPRVADAAAGPVKTWTALNRAALSDFWSNGHSWTRREVQSFIDGLRKLA